MTTASTIIVYHKDGMVSVSTTLPPGVSMSGHIVDRYRVHGSSPLAAFPGKHALADFKLWKKAREAEGYVFEPFPI